MPRAAVIVALLAACLGEGISTGQEFMTEQDFVQSTAVDRLIFPDDATVAPFPYVSPLERNYFSVDFIGFTRDNSTDDQLATINDSSTAILNSNGINFLNEPGMRVLLGRRMNDFFAVEASYFGLLTWDGTVAVRNNSVNAEGTEGNLFSPFTGFGDPAVVGLDYNDFVAARTQTNFNSAELNLRQRLEMPYSMVQVTALYGFRYLNVRDRFSYRSQSASPVPAGSTVAVDVDAKNRMFGVQLGGSIEFHVERRAWLSFEMKGIMLQNDISQSTDFTATSAGVTSTATGSGNKGHVMFAGDLLGACTWKFTPRLVGRAGYQAVFVEGLALGSETFAGNTATISSSPGNVFFQGQAIFHGPFVGLTYTW